MNWEYHLIQKNLLSCPSSPERFPFAYKGREEQGGCHLGRNALLLQGQESPIQSRMVYLLCNIADSTSNQMCSKCVDRATLNLT